MPAFRRELELLTQHKEIHKGLDKFEAYVDDCKAGKKDLRMEEMYVTSPFHPPPTPLINAICAQSNMLISLFHRKTILDSFGDVLWAHLSDEVEQLSVENMRKCWSVEEVKRLPM